MKISDTMDLGQLAERMSRHEEISDAQARHMRAALVGIGAWSETQDVPEDEWARLVEGAVAQAAHD